MVCREDDDGVVGERQAFERSQDLPHGVIDHGDHAVGQGDDVSSLLGGHREGRGGSGPVGDSALQLIAHPQQRRNISLVERRWQLDPVRIIHIPIFAGRRERVVRIGK